MTWLIEKDGVLVPATKQEEAILRKLEIEKNPSKCTVIKNSGDNGNERKGSQTN